MTLAGSSKVSYLAVGIPYFFIRSLLNTLLASMRAAVLSGPKAGMPTAARARRPCPGQGVILGDDYIVKGFLFGKGDHGVHVGGGDGLAVGIVADAAVAGCAPDLGAEGAFFQCADNGVLAPAAAYNQNFHKRPP